MKVTIEKIPHKGTLGQMTFLYYLGLDGRSYGYFYTLRVLLASLTEYEDKVTVKNTFLPLEENCIGIKVSDDQGVIDKSCPFYEVIFSTYPSIKVGYRFQMCNDEFRKVVGRIPFRFYNSFYFTINKSE